MNYTEKWTGGVYDKTKTKILRASVRSQKALNKYVTIVRTHEHPQLMTSNDYFIISFTLLHFVLAGNNKGLTKYL